jgi:hypothetical protein
MSDPFEGLVIPTAKRRNLLLAGGEYTADDSRFLTARTPFGMTKPGWLPFSK